MKRIFAASALLMAFMVHAQTTPTKEYKVQADAGSAWFSSKGAACASFVATAPKSQLVGDAARYTVSNPTVQKFDGADTCGYSIYDTYYNTDLGVSLSTAQWFLERDSTSGGGGDPGGGGNLCASKVGNVGTVNWTEGFTTTNAEGDRKAVGAYTPPPSNGEICEAGCLISAQVSGPGVQPYVSQQPTDNGLYRRSLDMPTIALGTACTVKPDAPNVPTTAEPKCPGAVGLVNNVQTCVSTPAAPVPTTSMPAAPGAPAIAGNPSAGIKPGSGEGSGSGSEGRTPDAGVGGNSGGSAQAAVGGKGGSAGGTATGTGTVKAPAAGEQQAACGAPGQPVCAVKMDETGYPAASDMTKGTEALNTAKDAAEASITAAHQIQAPSWSFSFQLPTGCTPFDTGIRGFVLDPCKYQSMIHDLMSMIWAAVTAFCIIGMVGRTIREA